LYVYYYRTYEKAVSGGGRLAGWAVCSGTFEIRKALN